MSQRRGLFVFLFVLYVATYLVRVFATEDRVSAGHGDVSGYYHVAKNLATGRGFVQDFVAEYLEDPQAIPTPSNTWWLPLPSIIASIGMWISGDTSYVAAKYAMIAISSLIPLLCFFAGWFLLRSRVAGTAVAILALGFHLYLDQPNATLSHGPYGLFAAGALVVVMAWREHPRILPLFGIGFGFTYLCRGDGQALVAGLIVTLLVDAYARRQRRARALESGTTAVTTPPTPDRVPWRSLALAFALFVAIAAPWWVRNLRVIGTPMPSGMSKITWARDFEDWFVSDTSQLTFENYREWGIDNILEQKRDGVVDALVYTPFVLYRSITREQGSKPGAVDFLLEWVAKWVMTPLMFLGLFVLLAKRTGATLSLLLHLALLTVIYGIVFPAVGRESYRSALFSVFPILLTAIIAGLGMLLLPLKRISERAWQGALLFCALLLSVANVVTALPYLRAKSASHERMLLPYRAFGVWASKRGLDNETFMVRNPWQFTVETGLKSAILPNDGVNGMLHRARLFGAKYVIDEFSGGRSITQWRPALQRLIDRGELMPAFPQKPPWHFRIYRIGDSLLARPR